MISDATIMPQTIAIMAMDSSSKPQSPTVGLATILPAMPRGKQPKSSELRALIARRLQAARKAFDPNQAAVARALLVSPQTMNKYEKGTTFPDELFLVRFSDLTGVPMDFLFRGLFPQEMPAVLAARIGLIDPELVPPAPAGAAMAAAALESSE